MNSRRAMLLAWVLLVLLGGVLLLGAGVGSQGLEVFGLFWGGEPADAGMARQIVWDIRLPRTLGAVLAGMLLGLSGALAQGLFRNPLADPYLLGSASGASLGVAVALAAWTGQHWALGDGANLALFSSDWVVRIGLTGAAFLGSVLAVALTLTLAGGVQQSLRLLLSGVIVGVVLGALSSLITLFEPATLPAMQSFALGTTAYVGWSSVGLMAAVMLGCLILATAFARVLDALSLGEATARSMGLPLAPLRLMLVLVLALATATSVAQTGLIAFVGLAAPHLVRSLVLATHRAQVVLASLMGGLLLSCADVLARWWLAPQELPVGVLTAVLGGGYLLWLMYRQTHVMRGGGR